MLVEVYLSRCVRVDVTGIQALQVFLCRNAKGYTAHQRHTEKNFSVKFHDNLLLIINY